MGKRCSVPELTMTVLRVVAGWHLLHEGVTKLLDPGWTAARFLENSTGLLAGFYQWIAKTPWALKTADLVNMWGLTAIGLLLTLGLLTRPACVAGAALLVLYSAAGSYLLADRNMVEACALAAVASLPFGTLWGLDRFRAVTQAPVAPGRRDLLANLVGVPALGAFAAAVLGTRRAAAPAQAGAARDVFIATASPRYPGAAVPVRVTNLVSLRDYEKAAPSKMSLTSWEYIAGGAGDDQSVYWNALAYQRILLNLRSLADVTKIDTRVNVLGKEWPHPIFLCPAASHHLVHPEGERGTAKGAGDAGATMLVSTFANESIENIAKAATRPLWHATYLLKERAKSRDLIQRAESAGYQAIVVPVDTAVVGARDREHRSYRYNRAPLSFAKYPVNYYRFPVTWADVEWFLKQTKLPVILKGIMHPEDAEQAVKAGAAALIVSNHGGRNLDTVPATIDVLPRIVAKVAGRVPVMIDGGIRRGTDVLKALALGAAAVGIGRPYLYGLAVKGAEGVTGVVNILRNELEMAMASTGRTTVASIDKSVLAGQQGVGYADLLEWRRGNGEMRAD